MNEILGCVAFCTVLISEHSYHACVTVCANFAFFPYLLSFEITYALSYVWCNDIFFGGGREGGGGSIVDEILAM